MSGRPEPGIPADEGRRRIVRPYGDDTNDGKVQVSFTLPVASDARGEAAARLLAERMGIRAPLVVHQKAMGPAFTFFIVYGTVDHAVDMSEIQLEERPYPLLDQKAVVRRVREALGGRQEAVIVGAALGTDAHTVGLDAILSKKGWAGDKGLESYRCFRIVNLRSQVRAQDLVQAALHEQADAVLVSQVVTQKDAHIHHLRELAEAVDQADVRGRFLLIAGGPRFDPAMASELGYDRIFGKGTTPSEVASYLAWALSARKGP
jgi:beta-lysine 5,6-aminomutase beta subunit